MNECVIIISVNHLLKYVCFLQFGAIGESDEEYSIISGESDEGSSDEDESEEEGRRAKPKRRTQESSPSEEEDDEEEEVSGKHINHIALILSPFCSLFSFIFSSRHLSLGFKLSLLLVSAKEPRRTMTMKRRREQMRTCLLRRKIKRRKRRRKRRPKQKEREVPASPQEQVRHTRDNSLDTLKTHMYSS